MVELEAQASQPFQFYTRIHLGELTGLKAGNLEELLAHVQTVPGSVIYHHTHHFLQQHLYLSPEPPNDFAYWVNAALNETKLSEQLASINTCEFTSIRALRDKIREVLERYLQSAKRPLRQANEGQEFYFVKSISFILPMPYRANSLQDFAEIIKKVTIHSIYFHMFEARLRLEKGSNDFSLWFETSLEEKELAKKIAQLDPYTHTLEALRGRIAHLIENRLREKGSTQ
ncbi:MAG: hypothetical protein HY586_07850 [Candidatus Omnitrophica bacterium]|nr:hypothetical protein [Candidatus Omnitrophota bacterium]